MEDDHSPPDQSPSPRADLVANLPPVNPQLAELSPRYNIRLCGGQLMQRRIELG